MAAPSKVLAILMLLFLSGTWATEVPAGNKPSRQQISSAAASTATTNLAGKETPAIVQAQSAQQQQQQMRAVVMATTSAGSFDGPMGSDIGKTITTTTTVDGDQPPRTVTTTSTGPMKMPQLFNSNNIFYHPQPWLVYSITTPQQPWMSNPFFTQPGATVADAAAQVGAGRHLLGTDATTAVDSTNAAQNVWLWHPWRPYGSFAQASAQSGSGAYYPWLTGSSAAAQAGSWSDSGDDSFAQVKLHQTDSV
jgi:hypothetical protein